MKFIKNNKFIIIGIVLGIIGFISAYAISIASSSVTFNEKGVTGATKTNVKDALDELYVKAYSYPVTLNGNHVSFSPSKVSVLKGSSVSVTVTPELGYYIIDGSCTNGYTIGGLNVSNLAATTSQTITINHNNSNATSSTCSFTVTPGIPSCPNCVFTTNGTRASLLIAIPNYTYNFASLNSRTFLGFTLDKNRKIKSEYTCGLRADNASFCLIAPYSNYDSTANAYNYNTRFAATLFSNCATTTSGYRCSDTVMNITITSTLVLITGNYGCSARCDSDNSSPYSGNCKCQEWH